METFPLSVRPACRAAGWRNHNGLQGHSGPTTRGQVAVYKCYCVVGYHSPGRRKAQQLPATCGQLREKLKIVLRCLTWRLWTPQCQGRACLYLLNRSLQKCNVIPSRMVFAVGKKPYCWGTLVIRGICRSQWEMYSSVLELTGRESCPWYLSPARTWAYAARGFSSAHRAFAILPCLPASLPRMTLLSLGVMLTPPPSSWNASDTSLPQPLHHAGPCPETHFTHPRSVICSDPTLPSDLKLQLRFFREVFPDLLPPSFLDKLGGPCCALPEPISFLGLL